MKYDETFLSIADFTYMILCIYQQFHFQPYLGSEEYESKNRSK